MPAHAPDLNRGHDKSLSFNLDQKTGEWKADFVRYRYKRDTELVVGCAGYAPTQLLLVIWPQTLASRMRPSAACFDHSVFSRFRVAPADACFECMPPAKHLVNEYKSVVSSLPALITVRHGWGFKFAARRRRLLTAANDETLATGVTARATMPCDSRADASHTTHPRLRPVVPAEVGNQDHR